MSIKNFINRPILSVMLSVLIVILGIIGLLNLPIEQYPDIDNALAAQNIVLKATHDGGVLRLGDVAQVELGTADYNQKNTTMGKPGASASITQTAGSNANEIIKQMDQMEDEVRKTLTPGMVLGTLAILFVLPALYCLCERWDETSKTCNLSTFE